MSDRDTRNDAPPAPAGGITRRDFVTTAALTGAGFVIVPRRVLGRGFQAPSDTVNIATVGIGGMGGSNTTAVMGENIVAICDVDKELIEGRLKRWQEMAAAPPPVVGGGGGAMAGQGGRRRREPSAAQMAANEKRPRPDNAANLKLFADEQIPKLQQYADYRVMLEKQKDLDAVIVATPDHMHAPIALAAMDLGKHVYVQKPLCWSVHEARMLAEKAKTTKVVTQMGNQGHSRDEARLGYEYLTSGAIGDIREIHVWTNRPLGFWPQGVPRPMPMAENPQQPLRWNGPGVERRLAAALAGNYPIPEGLSWDLFLGVAPPVEYHPLYHPFNWRGWVDWGQGALGDMGAHLIDHPFWSLKLGLPSTIETKSTPFNGVCFPHATTTYYDFPARGKMPAVKLTWYDGGFTPAKPEEMGDEQLNGEGGILYIGSKGKLLQDTYGENPRFLPDSRNETEKPPKPVLPRIPHELHELNWVDAIKGKQEISCPFDYAASLTEVMLLGIVSLRAGGRIHYDGANMKVTNRVTQGSGRSEKVVDPNEFLTRQYRAGWTL
ncbi:MAG TPA: Gfo/Idh/MocA family oxidoreductase [Vicinamibacterales bacterium]|nr:Gfo/Idh/MocA family oxidoreductase [Vicinamibacterales bacterium]